MRESWSQRSQSEQRPFRERWKVFWWPGGAGCAGCGGTTGRRRPGRIGGRTATDGKEIADARQSAHSIVRKPRWVMCVLFVDITWCRWWVDNFGKFLEGPGRRRIVSSACAFPPILKPPPNMDSMLFTPSYLRLHHCMSFTVSLSYIHV